MIMYIDCFKIENIPMEIKKIIGKKILIQIFIEYIIWLADVEILLYWKLLILCSKAKVLWIIPIYSLTMNMKRTIRWNSNIFNSSKLINLSRLSCCGFLVWCFWVNNILITDYFLLLQIGVFSIDKIFLSCFDK